MPASLLEARERGIQKEGEQFLQQLRADAVFEQIARDRKELARLRERVAGLLERNTSLVHTKRDLEARVKELEFALSPRDIPIREVPIHSRRDAH
jgi:hypothetical protein